MESSIAEFLKRKSACELLPTNWIVYCTLTMLLHESHMVDSPVLTFAITIQLVPSHFLHHSVHFITHQSFAFY